MAKNTFIIIALLFVGLLSGCSKKYDPENPIQGLWVLDNYENIAGEEIISFHRAPKFDQDKAGYAIRAKNLLISRQNSGWCATPPVAYNETQGAWEKDGSKLLLNGIFWGGKFTNEYEIREINGEKLKLKQLSSKYIMDK